MSGIEGRVGRLVEPHYFAHFGKITGLLEGDADRLLLREGLEHVSPDQPGYESKQLRYSLQRQGELRLVGINVISPE